MESRSSSESGSPSEFEAASLPWSASVMALPRATELKWRSRSQLRSRMSWASPLQSANCLGMRSPMRLGSRSALQFESALPSKLWSASTSDWL